MHFLRAKFLPRGGPDGGDGGRGGSVILRVDPHTDHLKAFYHNPNLKAEHGAKGAGRKCTGRSGRNLIVKVPPGTLVYRDTTWSPDGSGPVTEARDPEQEEDEEAKSVRRSLKQMIAEGAGLEQIADLTEPGDGFVLVRGGEGGKGNVHFKSPVNRAPVEFTPGGRGEEGVFYLELRRIADAGLVGFPNAGKSSLLGAISAARPRVAAYPFTTLQPFVGVVEYPDWERLSVADVPGIIEGAHRNAGLGHEFLRHILRCRVLLMVVDIAGSEGRDPAEDLATLRTEISLYDEALAKRPWLVIANKMDLEGSADNLAAFRRRFPRVKVIPVSALTGEGIDALKAELRSRIIGGTKGAKPKAGSPK